MDQYLPLVMILILATLFAGLSIIASKLLGPKRPTLAKSAPYECGIVPDREPAERFPVRFYLVAMIFIVFDIEIIFLFPWAVTFRQLGLFGLVEMAIFVGL
ncbi:MAG TPA: NADH-quinone oxidoreductase subunit A, partial [Acidimicrobiales bacterium]|nr:NADH-quinone oxidoreductase subunit A [Acidimicrobiales bacterium]